MRREQQESAAALASADVSAGREHAAQGKGRRREPENSRFLQLCDQHITNKVCGYFRPGGGLSATPAEIAAALNIPSWPTGPSEIDVKDLLCHIGMCKRDGTFEEDEVRCHSLCDHLKLECQKHKDCHLPSFSDQACYVYKGQVHCGEDRQKNVDVRPHHLVQVYPTNNVVGDHPDIGTVLANSEGRSQHANGAQLSDGNHTDEWKDPPYKQLHQVMERLLNMFRIFIVVEHSKHHWTDGGAMPDDWKLDVAAAHAKAKAVLSTALDALLMARMHGGDTALDEDFGHSRLMREKVGVMMNRAYRELAEGFHYIPNVPGRVHVAHSHCGEDRYAYVVKNETGFGEVHGPICDGPDAAFEHECGADHSGRKFVYLCNAWMYLTEVEKVAVIVHEAFHLAGAQDMFWADHPDLEGVNVDSYEKFTLDVMRRHWGCKDDLDSCSAAMCDSSANSCRFTCNLCEDYEGPGTTTL